MMSKWQHFLHVFGLHCWDEVERWEETIRVNGHGPHNPNKTTETVMVKKICCHCGTEKTKTIWEWVGL